MWLDRHRQSRYGWMMKIFHAIALVVISPLGPSLAAGQSHPSDAWEFTLESGYLRNVGDNTAIDYEIVPTQLTLRTPVVVTFWEDARGAKLVVRSRFSALLESIVSGPEDYYVGVAGAPSLEYWFPDANTSIYFSVGGGLGLTNSSGGTDGLGQDLTFNWFSQLGIRHQLTENLSILGGPYFIHHSNLGLTDPNPGIDALGITLGCSWRF